ncbi:DMT family transporter [Halalkalicoccus tibetensis]|uniref:DMT family transporter n=1 Tax=Halalkalicoccus tibetensis TaxID=175632 RepID=A0ABD5V6P1_9EURY
MELLRARLEALLVTVLWSSSYVLIAIGLETIPSLTFAGLRYGLATLVLVPLLLVRGRHHEIRRLSAREWGRFALLGVLLYALTQGAQFAALVVLRAATVSLVLSATPLLVALSARALGESITPRQWVAIGLVTAGAVAYFGPRTLPNAQVVGLAIMAIGLLANAGGALVGRAVNASRAHPPLVVTVCSMAIGAALLLATGLAVQGLPALAPVEWAIVAWLAVVNTAFAFTLWNRTLRELSATEASLINNTMLVQVALLGWLALDESLVGIEVAGLLIVLAGTLLFQLAEQY